MIRLGDRPRLGRPRRRWPGAIVATSLLLTVLVWVTDADSSAAQTAGDPFTIDVTKTADLVSGESVEVNVRTAEGTVIFPGDISEVRTCKWQASYTSAEFDNQGAPGTCVINRSPVSPVDDSLDDNQLYRFPDSGPEHGRRAITTLRPGVGTANWLQGGVQQSLTCGPANRCRLVFRLRLQTGSAAPEVRIVPWDELTYRPETGVAGCSSSSANAVESGMPDRLQEAWLNWTRSVCQQFDVPAPTNAFFQTEGEALASFAGGSRDLAYSAVGYRPGFDVAKRRPMVPVPLALNAVVLAVGGGYPVEDGSWPTDFPRPATQFRMTTAELATLLGQFQGAYLLHYGADVVARNPQVLSPTYLSNSAVGAPVGLTGAQATTLFATSYLDKVAPDQWTDRDGVPRGVETDLNQAQPTHSGGAMDLKTGRPDLARIVYKNLYEQGTYYVLTDLATATALGLTPVTLQNTAGEWVTPNAESLAAAVPGMLPQDDGTLLPNPDATSGYPLTFVEYAMAPAQPLVTPQCTPRLETQALLLNWLGHAATDGQAQLAGSGLVPLTPELSQKAATQVAKVGRTPITCTTTPPTTNPPTTNPPTTPPPASVTVPGSNFSPEDFGSGSGSGNGSGDSADDSAGGGGARPARESTPATKRQSVRAAHEAEIELPDLLGVRSINTLLPPLALLTIVVLSTVVALSTAGYPAPAALARLPGRTRRGLGRARAGGARLLGRARGGKAAAGPAS